jgi:hypothetical protein
METTAHQRLKTLAVAFLREHGGRAVACEVRCPISRYRVDVAGYIDRRTPGTPGTPGTDSVTHESPGPHRSARSWRGNRGGGRGGRAEPRTVLIECKQSRADFLRDRKDSQRLINERADLDHLRRRMEEQRIKVEEPHLRRSGSSLFPELEEWDFASSRLGSYRDLLIRLRRLDRLIHGGTKFWTIPRYALADRLYIAAPRNLIKPKELPPGWGLLECPKSALKPDADINADLFGASVLSVTLRAPQLAPKDKHRQRLLRNIAVSASSAASNALGVMA